MVEEFVRVRIKFKDDDGPNIVSITKQQFRNLSDLPIVEECEIIDVVPKPVIDKTESKEKALVIEDNQAISESFSDLLDHLGLNVIGIGSNGMKGLKLYICHGASKGSAPDSGPRLDDRIPERIVADLEEHHIAHSAPPVLDRRRSAFSASHAHLDGEIDQSHQDRDRPDELAQGTQFRDRHSPSVPHAQPTAAASGVREYPIDIDQWVGRPRRPRLSGRSKFTLKSAGEAELALPRFSP